MDSYRPTSDIHIHQMRFLKVKYSFQQTLEFYRKNSNYRISNKFNNLYTKMFILNNKIKHIYKTQYNKKYM